MKEDGVSVPVKAQGNGGRDEFGRFLKGNPGGPGRPTKAQEIAIINEISAAMPEGTIKDTLVYLLTHPSWRARAEALRFIAQYILGNPTQRIVTESSGILGILGELGIQIDE